jgi:hypothetical protein
VLLGAPDDRTERAVDALEHEPAGVLHGECECCVQYVGRGEPEVEPPAVLAERLGDRVDECGDVVVRLPLELGDACRRRRLRGGADPLDGIGWDDPDRAPAVECRQLHLDHAGEPRIVRPDRRHGGPRVASDHVVILDAHPAAPSWHELGTVLARARCTLLSHWTIE